MTIPAKYEKGVFRPLEKVAIQEGTVVEVHVPAEGEPARGRRSIKDLPLYGMWADRDDSEPIHAASAGVKHPWPVS